MRDPIRFPIERARMPMKAIMNSYNRNKQEMEEDDRARAFFKSTLEVIAIIVICIFIFGAA